MQREEAKRQGAAGVDARVRALLSDAARWRLLGRLFECPDEAWRRDIVALAHEVDDPALQEAATNAAGSATEGAYHSMFGPGGPAPAREVSYRDTVELGSVMSEIAGYYDAFGYRPLMNEAPDHVAVEVGFLSYLRLKEAYAAASGDVEHADTTAHAAARFQADHLATFAAPLAALLAESGIDYLAHASRQLAASAGNRPARARLAVIQDPAGDEGSEFPCADA